MNRKSSSKRHKPSEKKKAVPSVGDFFLAEELEGRVLYSAAPVPVEVPEAPVEVQVDSIETEGDFQPIASSFDARVRDLPAIEDVYSSLGYVRMMNYGNLTTEEVSFIRESRTPSILSVQDGTGEESSGIEMTEESSWSEAEEWVTDYDPSLFVDDIDDTYEPFEGSESFGLDWTWEDSNYTGDPGDPETSGSESATGGDSAGSESSDQL